MYISYYQHNESNGIPNIRITQLWHSYKYFELFNVETVMKINNMNDVIYFVTGKSWKSGVCSYQ